MEKIKIITAMSNPVLNYELKKYENIKLLSQDIQYQDGIFEILELHKEEKIDYIILNEKLPGEFLVEEIVNKIKTIHSEIRIIVILENEKQNLENLLYSKGVHKIIYDNKIKIQDLIKLLMEEKNNNNQELKDEIENLKRIIMENRKEEIENEKNKKVLKNIEINFIKNKNNKIIKNKSDEKINNKKIINKIKNEINRKILNKIKNETIKKTLNKILNNKNIKNKKEIISISGPSGVGKSIICINLAKALSYEKNKILILDFDILNNSLHTILGVKKYPKEIKKESAEEKNIEQFIIKINKKIDLISATEILFNDENKLNLIEFQKQLNKLKEKYNYILIDTSSECFFEYTKNIIKISNKNIFVVEANILEIKKAKNLLNIYVNKWNVDKNKFNILINKYNKEAINYNLLKKLFCEFNIIGTLQYNSRYNKLINKNIKNNFVDKEIRSDYINVKSKIG